MKPKIRFKKYQVWANGPNRYLTVHSTANNRILMRESFTDRIVQWSYADLLNDETVFYIGTIE